MTKKATKKNIIYTGKGDNGTTTLFHCEQGRISKSANVIEALGSVDELNSYIGIIKAQANDKKLSLKIKNKNIIYTEILENIQQQLFIIQAEIAGSPMSIKKSSLNEIELIIKTISNKLPLVNSFIISGGSLLSALLDFARTLTRRGERAIIGMQDEGFKKLNKNTIAYMNRLSSVFFALSRYANYLFSIKENYPKYNRK